MSSIDGVSSLSELIDTLWNVNEDDPDDDPEDDPELIDTLWNVKDRT